MTIKVTLEFATQEELLAYFSKTTPVVPAKAEPKPEKAKVEKAEPAEKVEGPKPETAVAATAPAPAAAQTASSGAGMTEADLTKVIVAAVARTSREQVLGLLNDKFNVTAGKQITDPAVREQAKQALEAL